MFLSSGNLVRIPGLLLAAAVLCLCAHEPAAADARTVEVRIYGLARAYMQPMSATVERMAALPGIESARGLDVRGEIARFELVTALDNDQIAEALKLPRLSADTDVVHLSAHPLARTKRAEARTAIMTVANALLDQPLPSWNQETEPLFKSDSTTAERLVVLGLAATALDGVFYKASDYKIEEDWQGDGGNYKLWLGEKWEGVHVPLQAWYVQQSDEPEADTPSDDSSFVGARLARGPWSQEMAWVDRPGLLLQGYDVRRADTSDGELLLKRGEDWMLDILKAVALIRLKHPGRELARLPKGRGWEMFSELSEDRDFTLNRWDVNGYEQYSLMLRWEPGDDDNRQYAILEAHHPEHPLHLKARLDTRAIIDAYKESGAAKPESFKDVELGEALSWPFAAEAGPEIFAARKHLAHRNLARIAAAAADIPREELNGSLADEALQQRLGVKLESDPVLPHGDYRITPQLFGEIEISVGKPSTGGRHWLLMDTQTGEVIRRSP